MIGRRRRLSESFGKSTKKDMAEGRLRVKGRIAARSRKSTDVDARAARD